MGAHVLLNLLNNLMKIDKMRGMPSILSLFRTEFNKFNNTGLRVIGPSRCSGCIVIVFCVALHVYCTYHI